MSKAITTPRKKLIEHSLPIEEISKEALLRKQKAPKGYPTSIHKYFAQRPIAICRALVFATIVDDPSSRTDLFPDKAAQDAERARLHELMAEMVRWPKAGGADAAKINAALDTARWEMARSISCSRGEEPPPSNDPARVFEYLQANAPLVCDPFCGGGSIPLEAQRLGIPAYGSDLNPVAVLITKALTEFPPKFAGLAPVHPEAGDGLTSWQGAQGLAEDVRRYGQWMRDEAEKRIGHHYPKAKLKQEREAAAIAWLWARTVASPDPAQKGAHVPLASSFILSNKDGKEAVVVPVKDSTAKDGWRFEVKATHITEADLRSAKDGTKSARGANFVCILSGTAIDGDYIKAEGKAGRMCARLMAIVAEGQRGREYLTPTEVHQKAAEIDPPDVDELGQAMPQNPRWFAPPDYGMPLYRDLFTPRQLTALTTFAELVSEARLKVLKDARATKFLTHGKNPHLPLVEDGDGPEAYATTVAMYLALAVNRSAFYNSSLCGWLPKDNAMGKTMPKQALAMSWDFAEANPLEKSSGGIITCVENIAACIEASPSNGVASVAQKAAQTNDFSKGSVFITDPPYYDNIGYADLSDLFYAILRLSQRPAFLNLFRRLQTPKNEEIVADRYRRGSTAIADSWFAEQIQHALKCIKDAAPNDFPISIFYAYKQSSKSEGSIFSPGWASFLQGLVDLGFQVVATWPFHSEGRTRSVAQNTNALAASVVLVCRRRPEVAPSISRRDFVRELHPIIRQAIRDHQSAGVPLPDRRQAAIGPGIGAFSKYTMVREADDRPMLVSTALTLINKEIDLFLGEGTEDLDAETRFALDWYQMHGYAIKKGGSGDAIAQLQAFNLAEARINASGIFRAKSGDAKLLTRDEMHAAVLERYGKPWRPSLDESFTVWELAQHMARMLSARDGGIDAAGHLLAERRSAASDVLLIAERLFELATSRGENEEALVWNELQTSWSEIESAADRAEEAGISSTPEQGQLGI